MDIAIVHNPVSNMRLGCKIKGNKTQDIIFAGTQNRKSLGLQKPH